MLQAEPPRPVSPARASKAIDDDHEEVVVEPVSCRSVPQVDKAPPVEAAIENATPYLPPTTTQQKEECSYRVLSKTSDFRCKACVSKGAPPKDFLKRWLPWIFEERDFVSYGETLRCILIREQNCFVYLDDDAVSPLYTICLEGLHAKKENPAKPSKQSVTISPAGNSSQTSPFFETVLIKNSKGKLVFQLTFNVENNKEITSQFLTAFQNVTQKQKTKTLEQAYVIGENKYEESSKKI